MLDQEEFSRQGVNPEEVVRELTVDAVPDRPVAALVHVRGSDGVDWGAQAGGLRG